MAGSKPFSNGHDRGTTRRRDHQGQHAAAAGKSVPDGNEAVEQGRDVEAVFPPVQRRAISAENRRDEAEGGAQRCRDLRRSSTCRERLLQQQQAQFGDLAVRGRS